MDLYSEVNKRCYKSGNGNLMLVFREKDKPDIDIVPLQWEDIVDIEKSLDLVKRIKNGFVTLNFPKVWWANNYKTFGENVDDAYDKFKFLLEFFVGSFDY